jgi:threonine aldolase
MDYIDLRSDTVTWPTPEMREAMANAPVGDDVWGDDPTVIELQEETAARLGKEAALFMPSGTMSNEVALLTHCARGEEVILGRQSHTYSYEAGGSAALGGIHPNPLEVQPDGTLALDAIRGAIRTEDDHFPRTRLICLENTQSMMGGIPLTPEYTVQVSALARENGLKLHVDGARLFNAAAALKVDVKDLAAPADSVSFCLSKGLCAPVGSMLVSSKAFIKEARRHRKLLGGGMRQVGVLAAAGLIALRDMPGRLHIDHENAYMLAAGLAKLPYIQLDLSKVQSNMIYFGLAESAPLQPQALSERLKSDYRILLASLGHSRRFRAVTHYWISRENVAQTLEAFGQLLAQ